jgi:hypothetical protein
MAQFLKNALAEPERSYVTEASTLAQPLTKIAYQLARIGQSIAEGDPEAATAEVLLAQRLAADALLPLRRQHEAEVRRSERCRSGWSG